MVVNGQGKEAQEISYIWQRIAPKQDTVFQRFHINASLLVSFQAGQLGQ
jgi:hypothetical protein